MLAETDVKISLNEKSTQLVTVFMDSLNFVNSYWQFFGVNVGRVKCDAASLTLDLTNLRNVTIENCTFGNWTFRQVDHIIIKNSSTSKDLQTLLNFYKSSGLMENINIKNLNFTNMPYGVIIQSNSYIQITKSKFANNTVSHGLIKVLNSSTLEMRDCTLQNNKAINYAVAIHAVRSFIYLTNTNFSGNNAIQTGGALHANKVYFWSCIFATYNSSVFIYDATFSMNIGRAISLRNNSHLSGVNSSFINNTTPGTGAAIHSENSTLNISYSFCYHNIAKNEGTFYLVFSRTVLTYCIFKTNSNIAVVFFGNTTASIANCTFENNSSSDLAGALLVNTFGNVTVSHTLFLENFAGSAGAALVFGHSSLVISNCSFSRNAASDRQSDVGNGILGAGGAISIVWSVLEIFQSHFDNNFAAYGGGSLFSSNSVLFIHDSVFQNNIATFSGGILLISNQSSLIIKNSSLKNNRILYESSIVGGEA